MDQVDWGGVAVVALMYSAFLLAGWLAVGKLKNRDASDFPGRPPPATVKS